MKVYISNNAIIGQVCKGWAAENMPEGFELTDSIEDCDIFISVCYDKILDKEFTDTHECFNFHPAQLPQYAGVGGCTWSILHGNSKHWVTLHKIHAGIDTGSIIYSSSIDVLKTDTALSLYSRVEVHISSMFRVMFADLLLGKYKAIKQDQAYRKLWTRKDMDDTLDLTTYMRATCFPGKKKPFYIDYHGNKIELDYV